MKTKYSIMAPVIRDKSKKMVGQNDLENVDLSETDKLRLYHDLEVHQIELELQNEELTQSREEAIQAAQKYTELYEAAPSSFFTLDRSSKILELNVFASQLLGKKKADLLNSYFTSFVYYEDRSIYYSFIENVFKNHTTSRCEIRLQTSESPSPIFVILTGISVSHWDKCLLTALDVSEQKKAQDAVLENHRLSAIGEMAASIAHDFNNSLQSLLGNLELAMKGKENSKYLDTMKSLIIDAADRVRQLQRFGGKDAGRNEFSYIDVTSLIEDVIDQTRPMWKDEAQAKGICIYIRYSAEDEACIEGNRGELRSALFNILKNSIEAMPSGGSILINSRVEEDQVFLTVTDSGIGMDEETKLRIFQPFYSTKDLNLGRGLGMSGVLSIIKEHHSDVRVKNTEPGKGTTIEIKFPLQKERMVKRANNQDTTAKNKDKMLNLLWVDDDEDIRMFVKEATKLIGHNVIMAQSGMEALQLLEKNTFDLVVTDIGMPEMNGWQLADEIKEKFQPDVKVAVVSGWGTQIKESELSEHHVSYILNKPFKISQLKELFDQV